MKSGHSRGFCGRTVLATSMAASLTQAMSCLSMRTCRILQVGAVEAACGCHTSENRCDRRVVADWNALITNTLGHYPGRCLGTDKVYLLVVRL